MGLWLPVAQVSVNIGLDLLLVGVFDFGLAGAGYASMAGMLVGRLVLPRVFFDKRACRISKTGLEGKRIVAGDGKRRPRW